MTSVRKIKNNFVKKYMDRIHKPKTIKSKKEYDRKVKHKNETSKNY